jgi:hypothetical protein
MKQCLSSREDFKLFKNETSSRNLKQYKKRERDEIKEKKRLFRFRWSSELFLVCTSFDIELFLPFIHKNN